MTLNPEVVRARCGEIEESVQRLERMAQLPLNDFLSNQDSLDVACYRLLVAIEAALALCYHVAARRLRKAPEDYAACFAELGEAGVIREDLSERLQRRVKPIPS